MDTSISTTKITILASITTMDLMCLIQALNANITMDVVREDGDVKALRLVALLVFLFFLLVILRNFINKH